LYPGLLPSHSPLIYQLREWYHRVVLV
jgi:hypothetical protein